MRFQPDDPRRYRGGRKPGAKNKRTIIREALADVYGDNGELSFWTAVATQAKAGCSQSAQMLANRLVPALKPQMQTATVDVKADDTPTMLTERLIKAAAAGELTPDQLQAMLQAISTALRIEESTELEARVAALERPL